MEVAGAKQEDADYNIKAQSTVCNIKHSAIQLIMKKHTYHTTYQRLQNWL
jgi:hypothetical protein